MAARFDSGSLETYGAVQSTGAGVTVPDAKLLFTGDYSRSGTDLTLTGADGAKFVVAGYFETDTPPSLISPQGAMLTGDVVTALAGPQFPGMYAQAGGGAATAAKEIGKVQTLEGSGSVVRANGVTETLKAGDPVFEGDVVMTGPASKMGIGFVDGTVFSMSASARMVLNSLVYDANGSDNSMLFNLVEGSFVFAAGQIAPTGDMKIQTPVATMGIRGTAPTVDINSESGTVNFSIIPDPGDGHVGTYTLYSLDTKQPIGTISSVGTKWVLTSADGTITEIEKTQEDLLRDADAVNQINSVYNTHQNNSQTPQAGPENNGPPPSGGLNTNPDSGENVDGNGNTGGDGGEQQQQQQQDDGQQNNNTPPPGDTTNDDPPPTPEEETEVVGQTIIGTPNVDFLNGTEGGDFIDGKESGDFINARGGNDTIVVSADDGDIIDGGAGTDTILVEGDLSLNTRDAQIEASNYEIIDLNETHENELTISASDIASANANATLTFVGGSDGADGPNDKINLSPAFYDESGPNGPTPLFGAWLEVTQEGDPFRTFEFYEDGTEPGYGDPLATAIIEQGIEVIVGETIVGEDNPEEGDELAGTNGPDFVFALGGNDSIVAGHGNGDDHYDGGDGEDEITYLSATNGVVINLVDSTVRGVDIGIDTIASLERFATGDGDDTLVIGDIVLPKNFAWFAGGGTDTVLFDGALNVDTANFDGEIENIEVIDLNKTHANVFTISVDDFIDVENDTNSLQIRGGSDDVVNLTDLENPDDGEPGGYYEGYWKLVDSQEVDGTNFDIYHFIDPEDDEPLAVAQIEQGITVNFLIESFENGFEARDWELVDDDNPDSPSISDENSTERTSSAFLSTTTGNEEDDEFGAGEFNEFAGINNLEFDGNSFFERGNAEDVAELLGVDVEELDELADPEGENGFVVEGSAIQTTFYAAAGQTVSFDWFFSTNEGIEGDDGIVNDIAFVVIDGEIYKLFDAESTGNTEGNTATEGWNGFSTILTEDGWHDIGFGVLDNEDPEVETNLNIDNIRLGQATVQSGAFAAAVMMFDLASNQSPRDYDEAGMTVESHYGGEDGGGHLHLQSNALHNHSACCSEPYHFELTDGGTFSFLGFDLTQVSVTGGIWTSSKGGNIDLSDTPNGFVDFSTNPDFQNVEWVEWFQPQGSSTIDNVAFSGGGRLEITGTEQKDILVGQDFSEALLGLGGDDMIDGNDGDDLLNGGSGNNTLTGGRGADTFVITGLNDGIDTITDYEGLDGFDAPIDILGLSAFFSDPIADLGTVISDYVQALEDGNGNVSIGVDADGAENGSNFTEVAVLQDVGEGVSVSINIGGTVTSVLSEEPAPAADIA